MFSTHRARSPFAREKEHYAGLPFHYLFDPIPVGRRDFSPLFAAITDDFEFVTAVEMPDAGTYQGEEARVWMTQYMESFDGFTQESDRLP